MVIIVIIALLAPIQIESQPTLDIKVFASVMVQGEMSNLCIKKHQLILVSISVPASLSKLLEIMIPEHVLLNAPTILMPMLTSIDAGPIVPQHQPSQANYFLRIKLSGGVYQTAQLKLPMEMPMTEHVTVHAQT